VLAAAVAGIDDRVVGVARGQVGAVVVRVAQHDRVAVLVQRADGVLEALALFGRGVCLVDHDRGAAQTLHGGVKGGRSAGRWLEEHQAQHASLEVVKGALAGDT